MGHVESCVNQDLSWQVLDTFKHVSSLRSSKKHQFLVGTDVPHIAEKATLYGTRTPYYFLKLAPSSLNPHSCPFFYLFLQNVQLSSTETPFWNVNKISLEDRKYAHHIKKLAKDNSLPKNFVCWNRVWLPAKLQICYWNIISPLSNPLTNNANLSDMLVLAWGKKIVVKPWLLRSINQWLSRPL